MRDFRDAKAMARALRTALAAKGLKLSIGDCLELVANEFGARDWNTLAAMIKKAGEAPKPSAPPQPPEPPVRKGNRFSANLESSLHRSVALANERRHRYNTVEHLLLALIDDEDAAAVMRGCGVDLPALRNVCAVHVDTRLGSLVTESPDSCVPTAGFHRVIQRTVIHVQTAGLDQVTGANVLVAIFSERESHAFAFLSAQGMNRYDAVNFIVHGVVKGGGSSA